MKNFKEIVDGVLQERKEQEKNIRDVAEHIIEKALKNFENPEINVVCIIYDADDSQNNKPKIKIETVKNQEKFTDLIYCHLVYKQIKKICKREIFEKNSFNKYTFIFEIPNDDTKSPISIMIKEA